MINVAILIRNVEFGGALRSAFWNNIACAHQLDVGAFDEMWKILAGDASATDDADLDFLGLRAVNGSCP